MRKMLRVRKTTLLFKGEYTIVYNKSHSEPISDEKLFLAHLLKQRAGLVYKEAPALREARIGGLAAVVYGFKPGDYGMNSPSNTGRRIVYMQTFICLLTEFNEVLHRPLNNELLFPKSEESSISIKSAVTQRKTAKLLAGVSTEELRQLLDSLNMGSAYNKPGEWAAAFRALVVEGILSGNAPEIARWAYEQKYTIALMQETFKRPWSGEWNEASQFANDAQKTVFRIVSAEVAKLLRIKTAGNNE